MVIYDNDNLTYKSICKLIAPEYMKYSRKVYKNGLSEIFYRILIDKNNYDKLKAIHDEKYSNIKSIIVFQGIEIKSIDLDFEFCKIIKIKDI